MCLLQMKAFINEAHYYADATIMFPVWPPEAKTLYTCSSDSTSSEAIGNQSTTTGKPSNTDSVDAAVRLVHCPKGMPKHPKNAVTGWGGWMADMLWNEVQWQYKAAQSSHPLKAAASA